MPKAEKKKKKAPVKEPSPKSTVVSHRLPFHIVKQATVTIKVGREGHDSNVHKDVLCSISSSFASTFDGSFEEAKVKVLRLPDTDVQIFTIFMDWLYAKELLDDDGQGEATEGNVMSLIELHIFADRYKISQLEKDSFVVLYKKFATMDTHIPSVDACIAVFENLSQLCTTYALVDTFVWYWTPYTGTAAEREIAKAALPRELMWEVMAAYVQRCSRDRVSPFKNTAFERGIQSPPDPNTRIFIFIAALTGETMRVPVLLSDEVEVVKDWICDKHAIPPIQQRLSVDGQWMADNRTLASYNVVQGSTLRLVLRLR